MTHVDIWFRPWTLFASGGEPARVLRAEDTVVEVPVDCQPIIVTDEVGGPVVNGKRGGCECLGQVDATRRAYGLPLPLKQAKGITIETAAGRTVLLCRHVPDAPLQDRDPDPNVPSTKGDDLMDRVKRIWTRLKDVEEVIADPATMWSRLASLWMSSTADERPKMDEIVKQARSLPPVIERLDKSPRRILRRVHKQVPLSRVQELDRRAMTWLSRRPGDTIAHQAGNRQTILAVAREENFNTLENRVLLAYAQLAREVAADYLPRGGSRILRSRERAVQAYGRRCKRLAADLVDLGVAEAQRDVTPNFVLLNNANYNAIWSAWRLLLNRRRVLDELWRWQARSWEEFSALAVMVALQRIEGAEIIATSPVIIRDEQVRGCWVRSVNPLGVLFLRTEGLIVEVFYSREGKPFGPWCTPLSLRFGSVNEPRDVLRTVLVWPLWSAVEQSMEMPVTDLERLFKSGAHRRHPPSRTLSGALVIGPADGNDVQRTRKGVAAGVTLGASGPALRAGIEALTESLRDLLLQGARL